MTQARSACTAMGRTAPVTVKVSVKANSLEESEYVDGTDNATVTVGARGCELMVRKETIGQLLLPAAACCQEMGIGDGRGRGPLSVS
jgi:hypothetical protein